MNLRLRNPNDTRTREQLARGNAIAQEQADLRLLAEFNRRVRLNVQRRAAKKQSFGA